MSVVEISKPFDTVDHKLDYYGVKRITNEWLASYLKNRK